MSALILHPNGQPARQVMARSRILHPGVTAAAPAPNVSTSRKGVLRTRIDTWHGLSSLWSVLPSADEIISQEGSDIWDRMRADDMVFGAEFQLMIRLLSRPWSIQPHEHLAEDTFAKEVAEYVEHAFQGFAVFNRVLQANPDAAYYGKTVSPNNKNKVLLRWKLDDGKYKVIFGDLRSETVTAERLKGLEGE